MEQKHGDHFRDLKTYLEFVRDEGKPILINRRDQTFITVISVDPSEGGCGKFDIHMIELELNVQ